MAKKPELPPLDSDGELEKAAAVLKQIRKLLKKKFGDDPKWPRYVADSLVDGFRQKELPLEAE